MPTPVPTVDARRGLFPIGGEATVAELEADPHALLTRLREREPVSWLPALGGWLVTSYELALQVMRDSGTFTVDDPRFSTAQVVGPSMLSLDGHDHARHRAPFARPFRLDAVSERFTSFVAEETDRLIDVIEGQRVTRGEVLGLTGISGNVTGPHLHFRIRAMTASTATAIDPLSLIDGSALQ